MPDVLDLGAPKTEGDVLDLGDGAADDYSAEIAGGDEAGQVRMLGPAGRITFAAPEAVEGLRDLGYEVEDLGRTIERARGEGLQDAFGGAAGVAEASARGALRGASFGLSDVAFGAGGGDPVGLALAEANPLASTVSEVIGGVAPGLLGAAPGAVGSIMRLSPAGLTAARSAQFVARGGTVLGRGARAVLAGAAEGAVQGAGDYVGRQALRDEAISSEALAARALSGGALGGLAGGAFQLGGEGLTAAARRLQDLAGARSQADDIGRRALGLADVEAPPVRYSDVLEGRIDDVEDARRALMGTIDDARARPSAKEVDDLLGNQVLLNATRGDGDKLLRGVQRQVRSAASEFDRARTAAGDWATRYQSALDAAPGDDIAAKALAVPPELADEGAVQLALLDEARSKFDDVLAKTRERYLGQAPAPVAAPTVEAPEGLLGKAMRVGQTVAGAAETAQDLGLPVPTVSGMLGGGVVGETVGLFLKLRAGANALRSRGWLPATAATKAASAVRQTRVRLADVLSGRAAQPARAVRPARSFVPSRETTARVARMARNITLAATSPETALGIEADLSSVDAAIATEAAGVARRGLEYLAQTAPKNPLENTPFADKWQPDPYAVSDWERRALTVADPVEAVARIMSDPGSLIEVETLAAVHPRIWADVQAHLATNADRLARDLSEPQRIFLGNAFKVPLSITQIPGYGSSISLPPPSPAPSSTPSDPRFGYVPGPSQSPIATLEQGDGARGRRGA